MNPIPEPLIPFLKTLHNLPTSTRVLLLPPDYDRPFALAPVYTSDNEFWTWQNVDYTGKTPTTACFPTVKVSVIPLIIRVAGACDWDGPYYFLHGFSSSPPILAISPLNKLAPSSENLDSCIWISR